MIFVANLHMLSFLQTPASACRRWGIGRFAPDVEEVVRGAVVSMEVTVVGFPGVEPSDKFLIEAIEELLPVVSAFFTWKAGAAFLAPKDGIMAARTLK